MYVELVRSSDNAVAATHYYGSGDIQGTVQINLTGRVCQTNFKRGDIGASGPVTYKANVYFLDIDGKSMCQTTSNDVTF